jgi:hypothetical protein
MRHALVLTLPMLSGGCTFNIYWTDYVVHGELHLQQSAQREPIPLELKVKGDRNEREEARPRH